MTEVALDQDKSDEIGQKDSSSMSPSDGDVTNEQMNGKRCSSGFESPTFNFSNSPDSIFDFSSDSETEAN